MLQTSNSAIIPPCYKNSLGFGSIHRPKRERFVGHKANFLAILNPASAGFFCTA